MALMAALPCAAALRASPTASNPVVRTTGGLVRGRAVSSGAHGVFAFLGVRYGAPTGEARFQPPRRVEPWAGIAEALDYGNQSPQLTIGLSTAPILRGLSIDRPESEDCLFLNVWTPAIADQEKRPVMVWLHGGGFVAGSGATVPTDGSRLAARQDVVVVSLNHRLGLFGYLAFPDGSKFPDAGNAGMLDIVLALRWVRENIAAFGGDPDNVTIFGESGGGCKVSTLLAMPSARGLFHKAIVQSGSLIKAHTRDTATSLSEAIFKEFALGCDTANVLADLPYEQIASRLPAIARTVGWRMGPVIDGRVLETHPFDPDAPSASREIPLLVGANRDEATLIVGALDPSAFALQEADLEPRLAGLFPDRDAAELKSALAAIAPDASPSQRYFTAASWRSVRRNALIQADRKAAQGGAPIFSYLLAYRTPADGGRWGATHALDLPLVFDNVATSRVMAGDHSDAQLVADAMSAAWASFARTGSPGWPAYDVERRMTMVFDSESRLESDPDARQRKLFEGPPVNILAPRS